MCKKNVISALWIGFLLICIPSMVSAQDPNLVGYWSFDEDGSDSSGNGLHGSLMGDATIVPGLFNGAVDLGGNPDRVNIDGYAGMAGAPAITVAAWVKTNGNGAIFTWGNNGPATRYTFRINAGRLRFEHNAGNILGTTVMNDGEWHHVACANRAGATITYPEIKLYLDGEDDTAPKSDADVMNFNPGPDVSIGSRAENNSWYLTATIDEVYLYDRELSDAEIKALARRPISYNPTPADGGSSVGAFAILTWTSGGFALQHDVYFGENFDDVMAGTGDTFKGRQPASPSTSVQMVEPGVTYYWRIDDVEEDSTSVRTGEVWSFHVTPLDSHDPIPVSEATYIAPAPTLQWSKGAQAIFNQVYFSDSFDAVNDGAAEANKGQQTETSFTPSDLVNGTTYYWRVDAIEGNGTVQQGSVWSFTVRPTDPAISDPNLKGWWKLDEGVNGGAVFDYSGYGVHGRFIGQPQFVEEGYAGGALEFSLGNYVELDVMDVNSNNVTISGWVKPFGPQPDWASVLQHRGNITCGLNIKAGMQVAYHWANDAQSYNFNSELVVPEDEWSFLAMVVDPIKTRLYLNNVRNYAEAYWGHPSASFESNALLGGDYINNAARGLTGLLDDVRIYDKSLTEEEIAQVMRADLLLAWDLSPAGGTVGDRDTITEMSWQAGDMAVSHDVYLGTDRDAVKDATTEDTTGIYQGNQTATSFVPTGGFVAGTTYYWRIDEVNSDGSLTKGSVRSFTVTPYLIVDNFESYTSLDPIWNYWEDGYGGFGSGSRVDYEDAEGRSLLETVNVNEGSKQSMPFQYTNDGSFLDYQMNPVTDYYSEATLLVDPNFKDWTRHDSTTLALSVLGRLASPTGSSYDSATGVYTVTGAGNNLNTGGDQFHYVYTTMSTDGTFIARVDNIAPETVGVYAKLGLMIRQSTDPGAPFASVHMQPIGRVQLQVRAVEAEALRAHNAPANSAATPVWIRLIKEGQVCKAAYSTDGVTWVETLNETMGPAEEYVNIAGEFLVGIAVTASSGNKEISVTGTFSEVTWNGQTVNLDASADIGLDYNSSEDLYVIIKDTAGNMAPVHHVDNPLAVHQPKWIPEWLIDLESEVASQGVNLKSIDSFSIGVGIKDATEPAGKGIIYVDDIRLYSDETKPDPNAVIE